MNKEEALEKIEETEQKLEKLKEFVKNCEEEDDLLGTYYYKDRGLKVGKYKEENDEKYFIEINREIWQDSIPLLSAICDEIIMRNNQYDELSKLEGNLEDYKR